MLYTKKEKARLCEQSFPTDQECIEIKPRQKVSQLRNHAKLLQPKQMTIPYALVVPLPVGDDGLGETEEQGRGGNLI